MQKSVDFLKSIGPKDNVVIVFNNDGDGTCACIVAMKLLEKRGVSKPFIISQPMPVEKNLIRKIQTTVPDKIIFLDLALDQQPDVVKRIGGIADILIIDHHTIHKNLNSGHIVHYNPRFKRPEIYQSASYCTYKICSKIDDMEKWLWIAAVGAVSDYNLDYSKDLVKETEKKYGVSGRLYDSFIGRYADMISASKATDELTCESMAGMLASVKDPKSPGPVLDKMKKAYEKIRKELSIIYEDMGGDSEKIGNVIFYNIHSKYSLRSPVSTRLGEKFPEKVVVVWERKGSKIKISSRHQANRLDLGRLLQKAGRGLKAVAGGHGAAAGGIVDAADWEIFKKRLVEAAGKK